MTSMTTSVPLHRNRWVHFVFGLVVSAVCLGLAMRELLAEPDALEKSWTAFSRADYRTLIPIALATAVFYWFKALRWRLLLTPLGRFRTTKDLFPMVMIGFGFNNLLPAHLGEVIRVVLFSRKHGTKLTPIATSVALERLFDSVAVLTFLTCGLTFLPALDPSVRRHTQWVALFVGLLIVLVLLYVFCTQFFMRMADATLKWIVPHTMRERLISLLEAGAMGFSALKHPRLFFGVLGLSFGNWLVNAMVIHMALWSFGLPSGVMISCLVLGLTAVGAAVPAAPGYVGIIQLCFVQVLSVFSDDHAGIFAASIYYHLIEYVLVTLCGLYYFNATGLTLAQVQAVADAEAAEVPTESLLVAADAADSSRH